MGVLGTVRPCLLLSLLFFFFLMASQLLLTDYLHFFFWSSETSQFVSVISCLSSCNFSAEGHPWSSQDTAFETGLVKATVDWSQNNFWKLYTDIFQCHIWVGFEKTHYFRVNACRLKSESHWYNSELLFRIRPPALFQILLHDSRK